MSTCAITGCPLPPVVGILGLCTPHGQAWEHWQAKHPVKVQHPWSEAIRFDRWKRDTSRRQAMERQLEHLATSRRKPRR